MAIDKSHQGDFFDDYHNEDSSLVINDGVKQPPIVNPYLKRVFKKRPAIKTADEYMEGIQRGDTTVLSQAITLVESALPEHRAVAQQIIQRCQAISNEKETMRIGITGVPGAGKSTFIEAFGSYLTSEGKHSYFELNTEMTKGMKENALRHIKVFRGKA